MTIAEFYRKNGELTGFKVKGHSGYSKQGSDVVCASVSSVSYMVANTITEILKVNAEIEVNDGMMKLIVNKEHRHITKDILLGLKLHLEGLEEQYPEFIETLTEV